MDKIGEAMGRIQHSVRRRADPESAYECCQGGDGACIQHRQFRDYERSHGYLGKSRADRDDS